MAALQVMIVGATEQIGRKLGQLIAQDRGHLFLVDRGEPGLNLLRKQLAYKGASSVRLIEEDPAQPGHADRIYHSWWLSNFLSDQPRPLVILINVMAFRPWQVLDADPWEDLEGPEPAIHFTNLIALNQLFAQEMSQQRQGRILNVLYRPTDQPAIEEMFLAMQELMWESTLQLNEQLAGRGVSVSNLLASDRVLTLQSDISPAFPMRNRVFSAQDIAQYGYQLLQKV